MVGLGLCYNYLMRIKYFTLSREEVFSAAHSLGLEGSGDFGPCSALHGHDYRLKVTVTGPFDEEKGILLKAVLLKQIMKEAIIDKVDHRNLNCDVPFLKGKITSMENLAWAFAVELEKPLAEKGVKLFSIELAETEHNSVKLYLE